MDLYLVFVIVLLLLAAVDLTVGVANDAVNFLNSAIGSKAARFKVIMIIAALGILAGVTLSGGMMEVARKGIFDPSFFYLGDLMVIFVAVMFADILLLDMFNTFGLPTSTTVSIVFGLLGSALAVSIIKIAEAGSDWNLIFSYIQTDQVLKIVSAILLSIVIAFIFGSLFQYISRLIFTFDFESRFKKWGSIWGGIALTFLSMFILLKGAKGATFMTDVTSDWIKNNLWLLSLYIFIGWAIVLQLIISFTKFNALKLIVLFGTFALAMAFAANDLVNFIGAPLAGFHAFMFAKDMADPLNTPMVVMNTKIQAETWMMLLSGVIMVATLFLSKKARTVSNTEISLGSHDESYNQFESNIMARGIVRIVITFFHFVASLFPKSFRIRINKRFDNSKFKPISDEKGKQAFDLIRAAVILMVSAALISFATFLKLPLSTTYVTFIVAMAAALPDRAWGRESAVYRVSGIITVIGGWFFTAISAATVAMIIAVFIYFANVWAVFIMLGISGFVLYRTNKHHKERDKEREKQIAMAKKKEVSTVAIIEDVFNDIEDYVSSVQKQYLRSIEGLKTADLGNLSKARKKSKKLNKKSKSLTADILKLVEYVPEDQLTSKNSYAKSIASLHALSERLVHVTTTNYDYFDNNHHRLLDVQLQELDHIYNKFLLITDMIVEILKSKQFGKLVEVDKEIEDLKLKIMEFNKLQLKRIKNSPAFIRRSLLYINFLSDSETILEYIGRIIHNSNDLFEQLKKLDTGKKSIDQL